MDHIQVALVLYMYNLMLELTAGENYDSATWATTISYKIKIKSISFTIT
jgi:hypothetical protein